MPTLATLEFGTEDLGFRYGILVALTPRNVRILLDQAGYIALVLPQVSPLACNPVALPVLEWSKSHSIGASAGLCCSQCLDVTLFSFLPTDEDATLYCVCIHWVRSLPATDRSRVG